jgi:CheY-like chemotaxis protein
LAKLVLVVEDESRLATLVKAFLVDRGYAVLVARDGQEGLEIARREKPALVLSDVLLPHVSGWDVCRQIKMDPDLVGTGVVLMTAVYTKTRYRVEAVEAGADGFVSKPLDLEDLAARFEALLGPEPSAGSRREETRPAVAPVARETDGGRPAAQGNASPPPLASVEPSSRPSSVSASASQAVATTPAMPGTAAPQPAPTQVPGSVKLVRPVAPKPPQPRTAAQPPAQAGALPAPAATPAASPQVVVPAARPPTPAAERPVPDPPHAEVRTRPEPSGRAAVAVDVNAALAGLEELGRPAGRSARSGKPVVPTSPQFAERLAAMRRSFAAALPQTLANIERAWAAAAGGADPRLWEELARLGHDLAGSAGSFGLPAIGDAARELEDVVRGLLDGPAPVPARTRRAVKEHLERLGALVNLL